MDVNELMSRLKAVLDSTPPNQRMTAYRAFKAAAPPEHHSMVDIAFSFYCEGIEVDKGPPKIVVALLHGIRTAAVWQDQARVALENPGRVVVAPIGYGYFDVFRFLFPFRSGPIRKVERQLRDLKRQHPGAELVVVAHSFGTYIISKILRDSPDIRIARLLLCGSIIKQDFQWDGLPHEFTPDSCINEVGTKDVWPVFARVASFGYGCSGSFGFKASRVRDRYFDYGHSDFFTADHFERFWRPFVWEGQFVKSPWDAARPTPPLLISIFGGVPRWIWMPILFLLSAGAYMGIKYVFG